MALFIRIGKQIVSGVILFHLTLILLVASLFPAIWRNSFFPWLYQHWSASFLGIFGIAKQVHNMYRKSLPDHYILIANHPSGVELLWLPAYFRVIPLAKAEIRDWFLIGRIVQSIGAVFVNRKVGASRQGAARSLFDAVDSGKNVMIFPEGGCYGKDLNPFFKGAFHLSKQTGVPILPVYVHYEELESYTWGDYGLLKFMWRVLFVPRNRNAHLYIFDAVNPDRFGDEQEMRDYMHSFYLEQQTEIRMSSAIA